MTRNAEFEKPLLLADGAPGSQLLATHPAAIPPERLNLEDPPKVVECHSAYIRAGAVCLRTNTREAGRPWLEAHGLGERSEAVNNSASALARKAGGDSAVLMGALTSLEQTHLHLREREKAYGEQSIYLSDTGIDFFLLEHFGQVEEVLLALRIIQRNSDAPILAQLSFTEQALTQEGLHCAEAARMLAGQGADALGLSCGPSIPAMLRIMPHLLAADLPVCAMPGAVPGGPFEATALAELSPADFARGATQLARSGAAIIGGCCKVSPAHIAALAANLESL